MLPRDSNVGGEGARSAVAVRNVNLARVGSRTPRVLRFRTGAAMLSRLGSEQLKDEITAVLELVKNAYDADATRVDVELGQTQNEQTIRIRDNGTGMTEDDLEAKWFWLATENKVTEDRSPIFRRRRLGQKGVGRFATEKLGRQLVLRTRVKESPIALRVKFDWDRLSADRELSEYEFDIKHRTPHPLDPECGTRLDMCALRVNWNQTRVQKLRSQLAHLIDPEATSDDFKIYLLTPWPDLDGEIRNPLPGNETHRLEFELREDGHEAIRLFHAGKEERRVEQIGKPSFGPIRGRLRYFGQGLGRSERARGGNPDADWNVGIRIFRDGGRVRPYGEPGAEGDWLQIYRSRYLRGSRFRLKPHYLEGTIHISKEENPALRACHKTTLSFLTG